MLSRIEDLYRRAVHADPVNANNFSNYGLFLAEVRALDLRTTASLYSIISGRYILDEPVTKRQVFRRISNSPLRMGEN